MIRRVSTQPRQNTIGSLWMVAAMAGFAVEDTFLKASAHAIPIGQILVVFGLGGALIFATLARLQKQPLFPPAVLSRPMRLRVLFEITGRLFYTLAIALTPLSAATVILQATPLVVVACAAVIFGETVGWRRWSAVIIGLSGVVVIVQPGADSFSALSLLAVIAVVGFAGRDLASRAAPASLGTWILGVYGFLPVAVVGGLYGLWEGVDFVIPDAQSALYLGGTVVAGTAAYACLMKAMRIGDVSAVTPFRYTRLMFGIACGVVLFGERLTLPMIAGSVLILCSGLFILWRGTQIETVRTSAP